jgi:purine-binding chemotaxis protein CheW
VAALSAVFDPGLDDDSADDERGSTGDVAAAVDPRVANTAAIGAPSLQHMGQGVQIGPLGLLVRYQDGRELVPWTTPQRLPNSPSWLLGMANVHGAPLPVFDLARRWGQTRDATRVPMLLVFGQGAAGAAIVVDGLPTRLRWKAADALDPQTIAPVLRRVARAAYLIDDRLWFELDADGLMSDLEAALQVASPV